MTNRFLKQFSTLSLFLFIVLTNNARAQDLNKPLPFDASVTTGTLANGLKYYIKPNAKPEKKVELRLVVNAGSILENDNQQGLAHFMEHMNFNGTEHYPKNALVDFLQLIGVQFGADLNAYTSFDETVFILPIPTDKTDNLEKGFEVLSDWAQKALITDKDVDEERKVVLEESRGGKGADDRMMQIYLPKMLAGSRYADRLPIGKDDILKNCDPQVIRDFYKDWYRPNLMAVAVVGDITVEQAKTLIEKYFNGLKNPVKERVRTYYDVPAYTSQSAMVLTDKEATNNEFILNFSSRKTNDEKTLNDYRSNIIQNLFITILNNRLRELTQSAKPPFIYSYAGLDGWARGYEGFSVTAVASGDLKSAVEASIGEVIRAQQFGFTNSELNLAKKGMMSSMEKWYNERSTTESGALVSEAVRNFLTHEPMPGIENEWKYYQDFLPTITLAEVNAVAKKWLDDNKNYFALSTGPQNDKTVKMSDGELRTMVQNAFKQEVTAREEKIMVSSLFGKDPVPGKIISEVKDVSLGITTYNLSNGVKVTIKPTDFKSDEIVFSGIKKGGNGLYGVGDKVNSKYMTQVVSAMGYGAFNPTSLKDFMTGKNANVNMSQGGAGDVVNGSSTVKDLETMLQLNYLKLTSAKKDEELFKGFVAKQISSLEFVKANPQAAFQDTMTKTLYNNVPFTPISIPTVADLNNINPDRIIEMYNTEFANADGFHFFFVGNVTESTIKPLIEKYIASLPTKGTIPNYKDNGLRPMGGNRVFKAKFGTEQKSLILTQFFGEIPFSEDLQLKAGLTADILNIKVIEELREKIGGIYSGGIFADVRKWPYSRYQLQLYLPCGPESVDTLLKAADAEIAKIKKEGPSTKDLEKVKLAKLEAYKEDMKTNDFWSSNLILSQFWGFDKDRFLNYEKVVNAITADQIKQTANTLFDGKNSFKAILYPEK